MASADRFKLDIDICWVVGRITSEAELDTVEHTWQLQGVFRSETDAVAACQDDSYFIGPVPVGVTLDHDHACWHNSYFPKRAAQC